MKGRVLAISALALVALAGCGFLAIVVGSGQLVDTPYDYTGFTRIAAEDTARVTVVPDSTYSVAVTCDDNIVSCLDVHQDGNELTVALTPYLTYVHVTFSVEVHMPELRALELAGASKATLQDGFASESDFSVVSSGASSVRILGLVCGGLAIDLSGAAGMTASSLEASSLEAVLAGASTLSAAGTAPSLSIIAAGASSVDLLDVEAGTAEVELSGASSAWVDVGGGTLSISASGASTLHYAGSPDLDIVELSGASEIRPVD